MHLAFSRRTIRPDFISTFCKEIFMGLKITYSISPENMVEIDKNYDQAVEDVKKRFGQEYPALLGNREIEGEGYTENYNPANPEQLLSKHANTPLDRLDEIMQLADKTQKEWRELPWQKRVEYMNKAAENIRQRQYEFAAIMSIEVGKNRLEALGEVQESVDLITYYASQMEKAEGFVQKMGALSPGENAISVLKPYGVFAAIEPFNFPMALAAGAIAAAMVAGNTVVMKIASTTPWTAQNLYEAFRDAGLPEGVLQLIQGSGSKVGKALSEHKLTKGIVFTGSYDVGMGLIRNFGVGGKYVKPCIVEMGGKNPGIVCSSADIDKAVVATWKSAFGLSGQKCSELSRIYVQKDIADEFRTKLVEAVKNLVIGDPTKKETFIGPVIDKRAYDKFARAMEDAVKHGGKILTGGKQLGEKFNGGYFVEPTIIEMDHDHPLTQEELFLPVLNFYTFETLEEAVEKANDIDYGLTAGIFAGKEEEIQYFLDNIEAGVTYCNRPTGITTGAWPGVNSFCGWKGSGGSGKGFCGPYYVSQFMREQSQTRHE